MTDDIEPEADMTNRLGLVRSRNVRKIMAEQQMTRAELKKLTGISTSTIGNCFGEVMNHAPSQKTIMRIAATFGLEEGALDSKDFDPLTAADNPAMLDTEGATIPAIIVQVAISIQIGKTRITTEVDEALAARILKLIVLGEDL